MITCYFAFYSLPLHLNILQLFIPHSIYEKSLILTLNTYHTATYHCHYSRKTLWHSMGCNQHLWFYLVSLALGNLYNHSSHLHISTPFIPTPNNTAIAPCLCCNSHWSNHHPLFWHKRTNTPPPQRRAKIYIHRHLLSRTATTFCSITQRLSTHLLSRDNQSYGFRITYKDYR